MEEINDYFFIWLRQHYHEKVHSATKKKPMLSFETDSYPLRRIGLEELVDAFLVEEIRKVDKTGVFRLNGIDYQAPLELARTKIAVRYDPFDKECVQVYRDDQRYADAYPLEVPENVDCRKNIQEPEDTPQKTGLNYLDLLKEKDTEGLSYFKKE